MTPLLSIVIPTYNRAAELAHTLRSLEKQSMTDFEVVVADDGSTDATKKIASEKHSFLIKYCYQPNSGRAAARNMGIAQATAPIVLFIDDHIIVDADLVKEHYQTHQKYAAKGVGVVRGHVDFITTPADAPKKKKKLKRIYSFNQSPFHVFITNNISVDRRMLELSGGFDPDFKEYGFQDQELGYRLRQRGVRFITNKRAVGHIFNVGANTTEKRLDRHRQAGHSAALLYRKHPWAGIQVGVNIFNIVYTKYCAETMVLRLAAKLETLEGNKKRWDACFYRLRHHYFLLGIVEGLAKYATRLAPRTGKNVVMLVSHQSDLSGAPISLVILANRLRSEGYQPVLVLPKPGPLEKKIDTAKVHVLYLSRWFKAMHFCLLLRWYRPAVVHANTFLTEYALDCARAQKIKTVMHVREDLSKEPVIAANLLNKADRVIVISHSMVDYFRDPTKVDVVYNGLEVTPLAEQDTVQEEPYSILFVGTLEKRKGVIDLIKAVEQVYADNKRVTLTILGKPLSSQPGYYRMLQRYIKQKELTDVIRFAGTTDNVNGFIDKASLVVIPSHAEPFGRVVIEAMARKKIVIGTKVGGIPEIIEQYVNGFLVSPDNPTELGKTIQYAWSKTEEQKQQLRQRAFHTAVERFTAESYVKNVVHVYDKLFRPIDAVVVDDYYERDTVRPIKVGL